MIDYNLLVIQNPWWKNREFIEDDSKIAEFQSSRAKYLPQDVLNLSLAKGAVNIVSGPRQTGKSTALKLLIKKLLAQRISPETIFYFNCDALSFRQDVIDLVTTFLEGVKTGKEKQPETYIFLDEISSVSDWPYAIKWLVDAGLLTNSHIILTGSSSIALKKSGEFLPGRRKGGMDIKFLPINFWEYFQIVFPDVIQKQCTNYADLQKTQRQMLKKGINPKKVYTDFLLTGGFLKMIDQILKKEPYFDSVELYKSTLKSEMAKFGKKEINARVVLNKIVHSLTSETSYTNIAEEAELGSKNTAVDYLNFFSDSFLLIETLFYDIPQKRVVMKKNKKYYPTDPFLFWIFHSFISGANNIEEFYHRYQNTPLDSQIAESFVASELYKAGLEFYFYRNTRELDFFLPEKNLGMEVKYKEKITNDDLEGVKIAKKKLVISKNLLQQKDDILIIPAYLLGFVNLKEI